MKKIVVETKEQLKTLIKSDIDLSLLDTSNITDMSYLFEGFSKSGKRISGIEEWDTSNVVSMKCMFNNTSINVDYLNWNTSKVVNMERMFSNCMVIPDISSWDTSSVVTMKSMFVYIFNSDDVKYQGSKYGHSDVKLLDEANCFPDISRWNTSNVESMSCMFLGRFGIGNLNLSRWKVSNVKYFYSMFKDCKNFNGNLNRWRPTSAVDTNFMFDGCRNFEFRNIESWYGKIDHDLIPKERKIVSFKDFLFGLSIFDYKISKRK